MNFLFRTLPMAASALRRHVMRSALTMLGIVIGVGAVIAMVEIGQGAAREVEAAIASMGSNTILVLPGNLAAAGVAGGSGTAMSLTPGDAQAMADHCSALASVAPLVGARTQVVANGRNWVPDRINGTTPAYLEIREWTQMVEGSMFSDEDVAALREVCVVGQTVAERTVRRRVAGRPATANEQQAAAGPGRALPQGGQHVRPGSRRHRDAPLDHAQVQNRRPVRPEDQPERVGRRSMRLQQVNSLNDAFPSVKPVLYPGGLADSTGRHAAPVHFTNLDLILVKARSGQPISPPCGRFRNCCANAITAAPASWTTSPCAT